VPAATLLPAVVSSEGNKVLTDNVHKLGCYAEPHSEPAIGKDEVNDEGALPSAPHDDDDDDAKGQHCQDIEAVGQQVHTANTAQDESESDSELLGDIGDVPCFDLIGWGGGQRLRHSGNEMQQRVIVDQNPDNNMHHKMAKPHSYSVHPWSVTAEAEEQVPHRSSMSTIKVQQATSTSLDPTSRLSPHEVVHDVKTSALVTDERTAVEPRRFQIESSAKQASNLSNPPSPCHDDELLIISPDEQQRTLPLLQPMTTRHPPVVVPTVASDTMRLGTTRSDTIDTMTLGTAMPETMTLGTAMQRLKAVHHALILKPSPPSQLSLPLSQQCGFRACHTNNRMSDPRCNSHEALHPWPNYECLLTTDVMSGDENYENPKLGGFRDISYLTEHPSCQQKGLNNALNTSSPSHQPLHQQRQQAMQSARLTRQGQASGNYSPSWSTGYCSSLLDDELQREPESTLPSFSAYPAPNKHGTAVGTMNMVTKMNSSTNSTSLWSKRRLLPQLNTWKLAKSSPDSSQCCLTSGIQTSPFVNEHFEKLGVVPKYQQAAVVEQGLVTRAQPKPTVRQSYSSYSTYNTCPKITEINQEGGCNDSFSSIPEAASMREGLCNQIKDFSEGHNSGGLSDGGFDNGDGPIGSQETGQQQVDEAADLTDDSKAKPSTCGGRPLPAVVAHQAGSIGLPLLPPIASYPTNHLSPHHLHHHSNVGGDDFSHSTADNNRCDVVNNTIHCLFESGVTADCTLGMLLTTCNKGSCFVSC
jgi:hypothetical protein